jgi:hypothetical protein
MLRSTKTWKTHDDNNDSKKMTRKGNLGLFPGQPICLYGPPTDELLTLASATLPLAGANFRHGQGWPRWLSGLNLGLQSCIETSPSVSQRAQSRRRRSTATRWRSSWLSCYCQCPYADPLPSANGEGHTAMIPTTASEQSV